MIVADERDFRPPDASSAFFGNDAGTFDHRDRNHEGVTGHPRWREQPFEHNQTAKSRFSKRRYLGGGGPRVFRSVGTVPKPGGGVAIEARVTGLQRLARGEDRPERGLEAGQGRGRVVGLAVIGQARLRRRALGGSRAGGGGRRGRGREGGAPRPSGAPGSRACALPLSSIRLPLKGRRGLRSCGFGERPRRRRARRAGARRSARLGHPSRIRYGRVGSTICATATRRRCSRLASIRKLRRNVSGTRRSLSPSTPTATSCRAWAPVRPSLLTLRSGWR